VRIQGVTDLQVGDVGFSVIGGQVGALVSLGQAILTPACWFTHTYIVAEKLPNAVSVVEAMPGGARRRFLYGRDRIGEGFGWARLPMSDEQRSSVTIHALELQGVPYSFLDYLALATHGRILRGRVTSSGHMICSQLVDQVLTRAGVQVFDDGRLSQDVTPGALFRRVGALGEICWE